jgi:hypothetical protein
VKILRVLTAAIGMIKGQLQLSLARENRDFRKAHGAQGYREAIANSLIRAKNVPQAGRVGVHNITYDTRLSGPTVPGRFPGTPP